MSKYLSHIYKYYHFEYGLKEDSQINSKNIVLLLKSFYINCNKCSSTSLKIKNYKIDESTYLLIIT